MRIQRLAETEVGRPKVILPNLSQSLRSVAGIFSSTKVSVEEAPELIQESDEGVTCQDAQASLDRFDQRIAVLFRQVNIHPVTIVS